jgi:hypothetical protein
VIQICKRKVPHWRSFAHIAYRNTAVILNGAQRSEGSAVAFLTFRVGGKPTGTCRETIRLNEPALLEAF